MAAGQRSIAISAVRVRQVPAALSEQSEVEPECSPATAIASVPVPDRHQRTMDSDGCLRWRERTICLPLHDA